MAFLLAAPAALFGQNYTITTFAGGVDGPNGYNGFAGDGGAATGAQLNQPFDVALDSAGNLYIADTVNGRIRRVSGGIITTGAGGGKDPTGTGGRATDAELSRPYAVAFDSSGNLFIADDDSVWEVSNGTITTIMGGPPGASPAAGISVAGPQGLAVDSAGNLYISDAGNNRILRYSNGSVTTIAGTGVKGFSGDGGPAANAELNEPTGLAFDTSGNLFIADSYNNRVRVISGGVISTLAGTGYANFFGDNIAPTSAAFESLGGLTFERLATFTSPVSATSA